MGRPTTEYSPKLPLSLLFSNRQDQNAWGGEMTFTCPARGIELGKVLFTIELFGDMGVLTLGHEIEGARRYYTVGLDAVAQPLGGVRWWYECPLTGRRCAILYRPPGAARFASREAYGLAYASQRMSPSMRRIHKLRKGVVRLGGSVNVGEPIPPRPKGMREATYARKRSKLQALRRVVLDPAPYLRFAIDR